MASKKKDNPAALGIMGVVLVGALFSVGRSLFGGDTPATVRAAQAAADTSAEATRSSSGALPASERDPFSSPLFQRAALLQSGPGPSLNPQAVAQPTSSVRPTKLVEMPVLRPLATFARIQPPPPAAVSIPPGAATSQEERALARSIRVTAIVMGANPYAVLEPAGSAPRTLHSSESYRTLRLVAIRAGEIVLKGQSGIWTFPLATPENEISAEGSKN